MSMRLSLSITNYSWPGGPAALAADLARIARAADEGGLDTRLGRRPPDPVRPDRTRRRRVLEAYTTLGFLAAHTERVRLGTMVTGVTFRPPALLVKAVTTLDVLSGGRAWLGVGAGYHEDEAERWACRCRRPASGSSGSRRRCGSPLQMWSGDGSPFDGRHYRLERPVSNPPPLRAAPADPDRRDGRAADAARWSPVRRRLQPLRHPGRRRDRPAQAGGPRPPLRGGRPRRTTRSRRRSASGWNAGESPAEFAERCARLAALGLDHAVVLTAGPWTAEAVDRLVAAARLQ